MDDSRLTIRHSTRRVDRSSPPPVATAGAAVLRGGCTRESSRVRLRGTREADMMSIDEAANGNGGDVGRAEPVREPDGPARNGRVRDRLALRLANPAGGGVGMIMGALAPFSIEEGALEAYEMLRCALSALVFGNSQSRASARRWYAAEQGCDSTRDAISIVKLNDAIEAALVIIRCCEPDFLPEKQAVLEALAAYIKSEFGGSLRGAWTPSAADLEGLLSKHSVRAAKGKMTTAGIDAAIIHQGRFFGARGSLPKTRSRVDAVLRRRRKAERGL